MQSVKETIARRQKEGKRSTSFTHSHGHFQSDFNNNADKKKNQTPQQNPRGKSPTNDKNSPNKKKNQTPQKIVTGKSPPKEMNTGKTKRKSKKSIRCLSLPSLKLKVFKTKSKVPAKEPISPVKTIKVVREVVETFTINIADEEVIVNQVLLFDEEEEKNVHLASECPDTPPNYARTVEYFRAISQARATYLRAADCAGDLLLSGEVEGDAETWEAYSRQKTEDVSRWRKECDSRHKTRDTDSRKVLEGEGTWTFAMKKIMERCRSFLWEQFVDIFPCCVPE